MMRFSLVTLATAVLLALAGGAHAQRCPYLAQHQLQIQIQLQQQQQMQMQRQQAQQRCGQGRPPQMLLRGPGDPEDLRRLRARMRAAILNRMRPPMQRPTVNVHRIQQTTMQRELRLIMTERRRSLDEPLPIPDAPDLMRRLEQIRLERMRRVTSTRTTATALMTRTAGQRQQIHRATSDLERTVRTGEQKPAQMVRLAQDNLAKNVRQGAAKMRGSFQHSASVQLRITGSSICGRCHHCPGGSPPSMVGNRPGIPAQQGGNNPPPPALAGNDPRPPAQRGHDKPLERLRHERLPRLAPLPRPRPGFIVLPQLPLLQLPDLPPLGFVRIDPPAQPVAEKRAPDKPLAAKRKPAKAPGLIGDQPPPLPRLRGIVDQLNPLLDGTKDDLAQQEKAPPSELLPDDVVQAPRLSPLPGLRAHEAGLLPTLDRAGSERIAGAGSDRPSALELVLQPPPLPSIFLR